MNVLPWVPATNIYEVNIRQYTPEGSFNAFRAHLPRLRDLGVETLWFMPITPISRKGRLGTLGSYYACSDYTAVNPEYGTLDDFRSLVQEAHRLGFKVIIDWVANHTGQDHRWTTEHPEFYKHNAQGNFYDDHGWEDVIDLDYNSAALREAMIGAMRFWIDQCDIDGFRCDMAMLVPLDFWRQARTALDIPKPLFWLAECEEPAYHAVFDATYTWKMLHKMEDYWRKATDIDGLYTVLREYQEQFPPNAIRTFFTSNHDENSHSGSEYERLGDATLPFAVLCATWNGIPMVYSGQELPNKKRLKFFDKDQIDWQSPCALHDFYKTLLMLKKENPALRAGDSAVNTVILPNNADHQTMSFLRRNGQREVLVLLNLSAQPVQLKINSPELKGYFGEVFSGEKITIGENTVFELPAWGYGVYKKDDR
ncbi:MAG TPA: alpha-amylase family glycosyl hydrolase [Puia sp.]|nr:alpha-amylase family glycosyl hydrolase [Puia sp.]